MIQNAAKRLFRKLIARYFIPRIKFSYSQFGEDLILSYLFSQLGISEPTYLDIGANEPRYISNTYFFYEQGSRGVLVEPNPYLYEKLKKQRPGDIVLNVGIGLKEEKNAKFYRFADIANGLNTFSESDAMHWQETGMKGVGKFKIEEVLLLELIPINSIFKTYFQKKLPDFISIDVEGLDLEILKSMDFGSYRPNVICVETLKYDNEQNGYKNQEIIDFLISKGYMIYADTRVNTIFCSKELINK